MSAKESSNEKEESRIDKIARLEKQITEKDKKITELAQSVAAQKPPTRRTNIKEKYGIEYVNKYTPQQIKGLGKIGVDTTNLVVDDIKID